jgi:hypothetical protein
LTGSDNNGLKRRIASRHFQDAECFRMPKNPKIFVSVAIENALFTKRTPRYFFLTGFLNSQGTLVWQRPQLPLPTW